MKKKQSKLKMDNLEAIESLPMQELTPEESDKIVGGASKCADPNYPHDPGCSVTNFLRHHS